MKTFKLILVILCMVCIFLFSNESAKESDNTSNNFITHTIIRVVKIKKTNMTKEDENKIIIKTTPIVRKLAHFTIYLILGLLITNYIDVYKIDKKLLISLILCFLYAISDEIHQLFVPGRSGEIRDVLIDAFGSFVGICSYFGVKKNFKTKKQ